jgi:hypothetical protein
LTSKSNTDRNVRWLCRSQGAARKNQFRKPVQSVLAVQGPSRKYFSFSEVRIRRIFRLSCFHKRGARDRHERWKQDAMDAGGRARRARPVRTAKACGPIPRCWDQACERRACRRRWQESPAHRGEHVIRRKAIAQGMPVVWLTCCCLRARSASFFARKARGCGLHPAFPVPSYLLRDETDAPPGRKTCRGNAISRPRHCERSEAIHVSTCGAMDCFVAFAPRNDDVAI